MARRQTQEVLDLKQRFGDNLVLLRNRAGLSQVRTAERSGLNLTEISMLERGHRLPRLDTIVQLGCAIEVEPCALLTGMGWQLAGRVSRGGGYVPESGFELMAADSPER